MANIIISSKTEAAQLFQDLQAKRSLKKWSQQFKNIEPKTLKTILDDVSKQLVHTKDPAQAMDRLAEVLPLQKLQDAIRTEYSTHIDALDTAQKMLKKARYGLENMDRKIETSLRTKLRSILDSLITILESVLAAFGIGDFFKPPESIFQSDMKTQKIMALLTLFSLVSAMLIPVVGAAIAGAIVGGVLLSLVTLSLIYPKLKPPTTTLTNGVNLSKQSREGKLAAPSGRKTKIDEIAQTLTARGEEVKHALIIGQSGVGKTEIIKAFVQAIERGDYPELAGKQVFYFNMADLVNHTEFFGSGNRILATINEAIGRHRENFILVFDEVQTAFQEKYQSPIAEQLKTLLDRGPNKFPYVIAMTTEEEFYRDIYLPHPAFARRFNEIKLENTTPQETLNILEGSLLKHAPYLPVEGDSLTPLLKATQQEFPNAPLPGKAVEILSQCIHRTRETQKSKIEEKIETLQQESLSLETEGVLAQGKNLLPYFSQDQKEKLAKLETDLTDLEKALREEKETLDAYYQTRENLGSFKKSMFETAVKIVELGQKSLNKDRARFLLNSHFITPALAARVADEAPPGVITRIDSALIGSVIQDEISRANKIRESLQKAKAQIAERAR